MPRVLWLRRVMALAALSLVGVTWPLWTPQRVFPQVPLIGALRSLPDAVQWLALGMLLLGLAGALVSLGASRLARGSLLVFAAATVLLQLADQHRLQPWAYQFVLLAVVLALAAPGAAVGWLRVLLVSFYFHSAVTKLDSSFVHTLGQQFLGVLVEPLGLRPDEWSEGARVAAALVFPLGELAVAIGLCFRRTRVAALLAAVVLHALLLVILGPWGLGHKPGVLIWNVYFIVQDLILFYPAHRDNLACESAEAGALKESATRRTPAAVVALLLAAIVMPVLEPTGWFDVWPSWGLYATSAERVQLLVHRSERQQLPHGLAPYLEEPAAVDDPWLTLQLGRWSLEALGAPLYPQNRFQLGVAEALVGGCDLGHRARVVRWGRAARFSGERSYDVLNGLPQIVEAGGDYWLDSRPRSWSPENIRGK